MASLTDILPVPSGFDSPRTMQPKPMYASPLRPLGARSRAERTMHLWENARALQREAERLTRYTLLPNSIPWGGRGKRLVTELQQLFQTALERSQKCTGSDRDANLNALKDALREKGKAGEVYLFELNNLENINHLPILLREYLEDLAMKHVRCPLVKTTSGMRGPSFLVDYGKVSYFMKSSPGREVCCTDFLRKLNDCFEENPVHSCGFIVVPTASLNLTTGIHESQGRVTMLDTTTLQKTSDAFMRMARCFDRELSLSHEQLLFSKRINGVNFLDFCCGEYLDDTAFPTHLREKLFERLGRLSFVDIFVMGNLDRFVRVEWNDRTDEYELSDVSESNLGNVMLKVSETSSTGRATLKMYAIDNECDEDLVTNSPEDTAISKKQKYLDFMRGLFSDGDVPAFDAVTENFITCFTNSIRRCDEFGVVEEKSSACEPPVKEQILKRFSEEAGSLGEPGIARTAFCRGLREMAHGLRTDLIPKYFGPEGRAIRTRMQELYPNILLAIDERIRAFQQLRSS